MLSELEEVASDLTVLRIPFILTYGKPEGSLITKLHELNPSSIYFDFSPLKGPRHLAKTVAKEVSASVAVVDTHNIVPVWQTSKNQEFAAHTIRRKLHRLLESYVTEPGDIVVHPYEFPNTPETLSFAEINEKIADLPKRGLAITIESGCGAAHERLETFIEMELVDYAKKRNDASRDYQSGLSPYLHFGQISSLRIVLEVMYRVDARPLLFDEARMAQAAETPTAADGMNALFEELIVRKELSDNFCLYAPSYNTLAGAPDWARQTLAAHQDDPREHIYSLEELEQAKTYDQAWNTAQQQLIHAGKMHGYMRMYWAKKILEWTPDAETAIQYALYLNDAYSLDGGDPNGYVGVLWSIAGLHDRPWIERPIFGKIRYMNAAGLKRKFDIEAYIALWSKNEYR